MTTPAILPFIHAQGSWGEIGRQVGQMLQPVIERHLEDWTRHVMRETGCPRGVVEAAAAPYARSIQDHTPFKPRRFTACTVCPSTSPAAISRRWSP